MYKRRKQFVAFFVGLLRTERLYSVQVTERKMLIKQVPLSGVITTNGYFYIDEQSRHGLLIDAAAEPEVLAQIIKENDWVIEKILLTHGHFDHIGAVRELMDEGMKLIIHSLDAPMLTDSELNASAGLIGRRVTAPEATDTVKEGDELELAGLKVKVLHTPGHTPGSVCYLIEGELFTGDTMFDYGWGRTDLPGGNEEQMAASLRRLAPIVREKGLHAGH